MPKRNKTVTIHHILTRSWINFLACNCTDAASTFLILNMLKRITKRSRLSLDQCSLNVSVYYSISGFRPFQFSRPAAFKSFPLNALLNRNITRPMHSTPMTVPAPMQVMPAARIIRCCQCAVQVSAHFLKELYAIVYYKIMGRPFIVHMIYFSSGLFCC